MGDPGPDGTRKPPRTPDYATPATVQVATFAALQSALHAASAGHVIEVTADLLGTNQILSPVTFTATPPSRDWQTNVLVRPPLGERRTLGDINLRAHNTTVAGFDIRDSAKITSLKNSQTLNQDLEYGRNAHLWRCVGILPTTTWGIDAATEATFTECVSAKRAINVGAAMNDRVRIGSLNGQDGRGMALVGCYFAGASRGLDTAGRLIDTTVEGPHTTGRVLATHTVTAAGSVTGAFFRVIAADPASVDQLTLSVRLNGTEQRAVTAPGNLNLPGDFGQWESLVDGPAISVQPGDVLTVVLTGAVPSALTSTPLYVGVGQYDDNHADTVQFIRWSEDIWYPQNIQIRDSVIEGAYNAAGQLIAGATGNQYAGDLLLLNSIFIQEGSHGLHLGQAPTGPQPRQAGRTHMVGNRISGRVLFRDQHPVTFLNNRLSAAVEFQSIDRPDLDPSNTENDPTAAIGRTYPAIADLATIWPECPYTGAVR